ARGAAQGACAGADDGARPTLAVQRAGTAAARLLTPTRLAALAAALAGAVLLAAAAGARDRASLSLARLGTTTRLALRLTDLARARRRGGPAGASGLARRALVAGLVARPASTCERALFAGLAGLCTAAVRAVGRAGRDACADENDERGCQSEPPKHGEQGYV